MNLRTRYAAPRDLPAILELLNSSPYTKHAESDLVEKLRSRWFVCQIAVERGRIMGVVGCLLGEDDVTIDFIATHPRGGEGAGKVLLDLVEDRVGPRRRKNIHALVHEEDKARVSFFKEASFKAARVVRDRFDDGRDAYDMVYDGVATL